MKHRMPLAATAATAATALTVLTAVGGAAYATVSPGDEASSVIDVARTDKSGDVHVEKAARSLPHRITHSVELTEVHFHIDRTADTLRATYPLKRVLTGDRFRQLVGTSIEADKTDSSSPFVGLLSNTEKSTVRVYSYDADGNFKNGICKAASSVTDAKADSVTQTVPFSCLRGVLDHGYFRSFAAVEKRSTGADISYDLTGWTRDLPLSTYVATGASQG